MCIRDSNIADTDICTICVNPARNHKQICVVESIRDVIAIESTQQYNGLYHLLGGILSPLDGIGPEQLNIETLYQRVKNEEVAELIMALSPTIEGDTTVYYIAKQMHGLPVTITTIARSIAFGGALEYADEMTPVSYTHLLLYQVLFQQVHLQIRSSEKLLYRLCFPCCFSI